MGKSNLIKNGPTSLLDKGMDILKDPNAKKGSKAAAIGIVAIAGIATVAKAAIDVISQDKV